MALVWSVQGSAGLWSGPHAPQVNEANLGGGQGPNLFLTLFLTPSKDLFDWPFNMTGCEDNGSKTLGYLNFRPLDSRLILHCVDFNMHCFFSVYLFLKYK